MDSSIALRGNGVDLGAGIDIYNKQRQQGATLQDLAQQRQVRAEQLRSLQLQSAEDARKAHEDQTLRG
jgi:hypothetical protein